MLAAGWQAPVFAQSQVVRFGQSASLTGGQATYGKDVRDGIQAAFNAANRSDARGPRLELVTLDDGGDKQRCQANAAKLIEDGVTALVGLTSGAGAGPACRWWRASALCCSALPAATWAFAATS